MQRTKIEWVVDPDGKPGWTWNPVTGCKTGCAYCYARRIAQRFGGPDGFEPQIHPMRLAELRQAKAPRTIFVGSMTDLFGHWVDKDTMLNNFRADVFYEMQLQRRHTYLMLTKWPEYTARAAEGVALRNWWIGTSVDRNAHRGWLLALQLHAPRCNWFVSFEPLLENIRVREHELLGLNWVIIGAQTGPGAVRPERAWVQEIVDVAQAVNVPVFVKDNLAKLYPEFARLRAIPYQQG